MQFSILMGATLLATATVPTPSHINVDVNLQNIQPHFSILRGGPAMIGTAPAHRIPLPTWIAKSRPRHGDLISPNPFTLIHTYRGRANDVAEATATTATSTPTAEPLTVSPTRTALPMLRHGPLVRHPFLVTLPIEAPTIEKVKEDDGFDSVKPSQRNFVGDDFGDVGPVSKIDVKFTA